MTSPMAFAIMAIFMGVKLTDRVINILSLARIVPFVLLIVSGTIYLLDEPRWMMSSFPPFLTGKMINFGGSCCSSLGWVK